MGLPDGGVTFEVEFTAGVWTNVTTYVKANEDATIRRGRSGRNDTVQPGVCRFSLDNNDGRFTPGRTGSPYYPNVRPNRRVRVSAVHASVTYRLFIGYVDVWDVTFAKVGKSSTCHVTATDRSKSLSRRRLRVGLYGRNVLDDSPLALWPLTERPRSRSGADVSVNNARAAEITAAKSTGARYTFGDDDNPFTPSEGTTLRLQPSSLVSGAYANGYAVRTAKAGVGPIPTLSGGFASEFLFRTGDTNYQVLHRITDTTGQTLASVELIDTGTPRGQIRGILSGTGSLMLATSTDSFADDVWHHCVLSLAADLLSFSLYVDGRLVATDSDAAVIAWGNAARDVCWGGAVPSMTPPLSVYLNGWLSHLALHDSALSAAQVLDRYNGVAGFAGEDAHTRAGRILDAAGVAAGDRSLDTTYSTLTGQAARDGSVWDALAQVADTEQAPLFVTRDDKVALQSRERRFSPAVDWTINLATAGDAVQDSLTTSQSDAALVNDLTGTSPTLADVRATDSASVTEFGEFVEQRDYLFDTTGQLTATVQGIVLREGQPGVDSPVLDVDPFANPTLYAQVLSRDISDVVRLTNLPTQSPADPLDVHIEGYELAFSQAGFMVRYDTSPVDTRAYGEFDDTTYGRFGHETGVYTLQAAITNAATSMTVVVASNVVWTTAGADLPLTVKVDSEQMTVTAIGALGGGNQVFTVTRGVNGTTAAAHSLGAAVDLHPIPVFAW